MVEYPIMSRCKACNSPFEKITFTQKWCSMVCRKAYVNGISTYTTKHTDDLIIRFNVIKNILDKRLRSGEYGKWEKYERRQNRAGKPYKEREKPKINTPL